VIFFLNKFYFDYDLNKECEFLHIVAATGMLVLLERKRTTYSLFENIRGTYIDKIVLCTETSI